MQGLKQGDQWGGDCNTPGKKRDGFNQGMSGKESKKWQRFWLYFDS